MSRRNGVLQPIVEKGLLDKLNHIVTSDFGKVTYTEAVEMLKNCGKTFEYPVEWG